MVMIPNLCVQRLNCMLLCSSSPCLVYGEFKYWRINKMVPPRVAQPILDGWGAACTCMSNYDNIIVSKTAVKASI